jgi:hypothetical protein
MATGHENIPPTVVERYQVAVSTSDLTGFGGMIPNGYGKSASNVLIAAALSSKDSMGQVLSRLLDEWQGAAKPPHPTESIIKALADRYRADDEKDRAAQKAHGTSYKPCAKPESRARSEALVWYARELRRLSGQLKSRRAALEKLHAYAKAKGFHEDDVGPALFHFLSPACPVCNGLGSRKVPGAPALGKPCYACEGTGNTIVNAPQSRMRDWLETQLKQAGGDMKRILRG